MLLPLALRLQLEADGERKLFIFPLRLSWLLLIALLCLALSIEIFKPEWEGDRYREVQEGVREGEEEVGMSNRCSGNRSGVTLRFGGKLLSLKNKDIGVVGAGVEFRSEEPRER